MYLNRFHNFNLGNFRSNEDIILLIRNGEHDDFGAEKLGGLLKLLPEVDEVEMLRNFDGDKTKLGDAEKFLLLLMEVPKYALHEYEHMYTYYLYIL